MIWNFPWGMVQAALELTVTGAVQGVGYRYAVCQQARILGLAGSARNNPDGSVTVQAVGERVRLQAFLDWCYTGVRSARVANIRAVWGAPTGRHKNFGIADS